MNEGRPESGVVDSPDKPTESEWQELGPAPNQQDRPDTSTGAAGRAHEIATSRQHPRGTVLESVVGDIKRQPGVEAIVMMTAAAHPTVHTAAAGDQHPPRPVTAPGQASATRSGRSNQIEIHCFGPARAAGPAADILLAGCYRSALRLASAQRVTSIAFAAISTAPFGYTIEMAARIGCRAVVAELVGDTTVQRVRFVSPRAGDARLFSRALDEALAALHESMTPSRPSPLTASWVRRR